MKQMQFILIFVFLTLANCSFAQVKISGTVLGDKKKPLYGASVTLVDTYDGATTDSAGNFTFVTTEKGTKMLEISMSSYKTHIENITISSIDLHFQFQLKSLVTDLNAVVITAGSFEASDKKKGSILTSMDIVTTAGADADITAAFKSLPGTQQVGEQEGLFVRGGSATETKIFMDGNLVNNFFYSSLPGMATRGRFNPFLFKGTVFSAGGYSALYGQALSAALILESNDLPEKTEGSISVSVIGLGAGIQKLSDNKKSSWGATYNYANLKLAFELFPQQQDYFSIPQFHDMDFNYRKKTRNGMLKYYGYASFGKMGFSYADIDTAHFKNAFRLKNVNSFHNIHWRENVGAGWKMNLGLSYSYDRDRIRNAFQNEAGQPIFIYEPIDYAFKHFALTQTENHAQVRIVMEKRLKGLSALRFGAEHFYNHQKSSYTAFDSSVYHSTIDDQVTAAFAETDIYFTKNWAGKIGVRTEYADLIKAWNLAPRVSLAYQFAAGQQVSFATGTFYQKPELKFLPQQHKNLGYAKADHYILQYQLNKKNRILRLEGFYKNYRNLYLTGPADLGNETITSNRGKGFAKGIELFWRDKESIQNFDYWVSYSYLNTSRHFNNYPYSISPDFAAEHTASLVLKKFVLPWKTGFNASYNFATGRPYYHIQYNPGEEKYELKAQGKTIPYHNLSLSINYVPGIGKSNQKLFSVFVLSMNNVLAQKQVFGYRYSDITNRKTAITPTSKQFVFLGWFASFGVDRTEDAINNNL